MYNDKVDSTYLIHGISLQRRKFMPSFEMNCCDTFSFVITGITSRYFISSGTTISHGHYPLPNQNRASGGYY